MCPSVELHTVMSCVMHQLFSLQQSIIPGLHFALGRVHPGTLQTKWATGPVASDASDSQRAGPLFFADVYIL